MIERPDGGDLLLLIAQLALVAAVIDTARRAVARLVPNLAGTERWIAIACVALAVPILLVQALGFSGLLSAASLATGVGLLWVAARLLPAGEAHAPAPADPDTDPEPSDRFVLLPVFAACLVFAPILVRALLSVPTDWDGLSYHLLYPTRWLQEGRIAPVEFGPPHDQATLYPANGEALHAFAMALVRSDLLVALQMVACALLFGVAVAALARAIGAARGPAATAGALAVTLPTAASRAATSYVEPLLNLTLIATLLFIAWAVGRPERARRYAALAGLAAGLAAGTKYVALPLVATLLVALPLLLRRRLETRDSVRCGLVYGVTAAVVGGSWYLRNALLVGNPFFPTPIAGLPHLDRPGLDWSAGSLLTHGRELAARFDLGDLLFSLPPASQPGLTLGPVVLAVLMLAAAATFRAVRGRRDIAPPGSAAPFALALLALVVLTFTYLRVPWWGNSGLLRSLVRFAVPAASVACAIAATLPRRPRWQRVFTVLGSGGVLVQGHLTGALESARSLAAGLPVLLPPLLLAALLVLAARRRTPRTAGLLRTLAAGCTALALLLAWAFREADRPRRLLEPRSPGPFAAAALAAERAHPGPATSIWASSGYHEFLDLFTGRRLERRLIGLRRHPAELPGYRRLTGEGSVVPVDRGFWHGEVARSGADLLIVSRWGAADDRWPVEESWAVAAGWPRLVDQRDFRVYGLPGGGDPAGSDRGTPGSTGGPQPPSQPRAR